MFRPQSRIASGDLVSRGTLCQVIENHGDGNASASGAEVSSTNSGVAAEVLLPNRHATIVSRLRARLSMSNYVRARRSWNFGYGNTASPVESRSRADSRFGRRVLWGRRRTRPLGIVVAHESIEFFLDEMESANAEELIRQRDRSTHEFQEGLTVSWGQVKHDNGL